MAGTLRITTTIGTGNSSPLRVSLQNTARRFEPSSRACRVGSWALGLRGFLGSLPGEVPRSSARVEVPGSVPGEGLRGGARWEGVKPTGL
jgi:hypothetical protein